MIELPANCVGRIVWGNPGKSSNKTDNKTKQPIVRDGQPVIQWVYGVAYPKPVFLEKIWPAMNQEAATGYPNGVPQGFAWKMVDGDGVDKQGKPYSSREGYAGCYVLSIGTEAFAPNIFRQEGNGYVQMPPEAIKTGDYVATALNIKLNVPKERTHTPGLYVNPQGILFVGYGAPIINGPDAQTMFGGQQFQLPPGASPTPIMPPGAPGMPIAGQPTPIMPPGAPGMPIAGQPMPGAGYTPPGAPQPGYAPPGQPQPGYQPPPQPGYVPPGPGYPQPGAPLPPPAHDFVHGAGQPQPGYQPPGMAPQPGYAPPGPGYAPPGMPGAPQPGYAPPGQPQPGYQPPPQAGYPMPGAPGNYRPN